MKNKLFFLLVLPVVWFVVAIISDSPSVDKVYLLSVVPSLWLRFFETSFSIESLQFQFGGVPVIFLIGLVLLKLKMKPRTIIISSVVTAFILWLTLVTLMFQTRAIKVPGAPFVWLLCCFNLSLCLLPFVALVIKLVSKIRKTT